MVKHDIKGYEGLYAITRDGGVWSHIREKYLKPDNVKGYLRVKLHKDGGVRREFIHRLVGMEFIPNPDNKPFINHLNSIKDDNRVENLEWCTQSENIKHAFKTGTKTPTAFWKGKKGGDNYSSKSGKIRMPNGDILIFKGQAELCREFGLQEANLSLLLSGRQKEHKGWTRV